MPFLYVCTRNKYIFAVTIYVEFSSRGHCPLLRLLILALESVKLLPLLSTDQVLKEHIHTIYKNMKSHYSKL